MINNNNKVKQTVLNVYIGNPVDVFSETGDKVALFPIELLVNEGEHNFLLQGKAVIVEKVEVRKINRKPIETNWVSE